MLHMESPHQGIYAPLSQVMTDSDSEEEIHNSTKHRQQQLLRQQQNRRQPPPNNLALTTALPTYPRHLQLDRQRQLMQQHQEQLQRQQKYQLNSTTTTLTNGHQPSSYTTNMQNTFRSVMMSDMGMNGDGAPCDPGSSNFSSFNSDYDERNHIDADDVAILGNTSHNNNPKNSARTPMSPARRCCFISSLVLCALAVIGFVWVVPCGEGSACPAPADRVKTHNWLNNYTRIELKGGVNIVSGLRNWENNMIFLYRGDRFFRDAKAPNSKPNGIISLIGSSGAIAWFDEMVDEPVAIDCTLLDVDRTGRPDCLVIDEYGELAAINPISGQRHWLYEERAPHKIDASDFPVILPDLDGDGVLEILLVSSAPLRERTKGYVSKGETKKTHERNYLRILSGRHGKPIGDGFKVQDCTVLRKLQLETSRTVTVTYSCLKNNTEAQRSKSLAELYALITNKSIVGSKLTAAAKVAQHHHVGQRKEIDAQRNIYSLSGRELVVENRGKCPEDCDVTLILREAHDGNTTVLRNFTNSGMYGMVPAQWHFNNVKTKMSGFVMKFWKWNTPKGVAKNLTNNIKLQEPLHTYQNAYNYKKSKSNPLKDNATKSGGKKDNQNHANKTKKSRRRKRAADHDKLEMLQDSQEFNAFDHLVHKRNTYTVSSEHRVARSIGANMTKPKLSNGRLLSADSYKMQSITETVILVLFIGADTRIENTSQSNIVQFCRSEHNEEVCQPDLNNQENSMLIADLDQDGSQELVSYMTTYDVRENEESQIWKLVTYVRLLRLESELPAFYEDTKGN